MLTSELPQPHAVLPGTSTPTTTPPSVLTQGMTEKEQEIFYRLLINLFVDNPKRKQHYAQERTETHENISTEQTNKRPKRQPPPATP